MFEGIFNAFSYFILAYIYILYISFTMPSIVHDCYMFVSAGMNVMSNFIIML